MSPLDRWREAGISLGQRDGDEPRVAETMVTVVKIASNSLDAPTTHLNPNGGGAVPGARTAAGVFRPGRRFRGNR
jgi:hypothetical protein